MKQRLQKLLASAGHGSRRECEEYIRQGRVRVNGAVADLGQKADPAIDDIRLDGEPVGGPEEPRYLMLHKPAGVLSSLQSQGGHPTVDQLVQVAERVYPVGRLDLESEGLLLLTNDGDLTHRLTHPSFEHEKEYRVLFDRNPTAAQLDAWRSGVHVPGLGRTAPAQIRLEGGGKAWARIVMHEGMKRQIRETANHLGLDVVRLIRIRMATLELGRLPKAEWRELSEAEVAELKSAADVTDNQPDRQGEWA